MAAPRPRKRLSSGSYRPVAWTLWAGLIGASVSWVSLARDLDAACADASGRSPCVPAAAGRNVLDRERGEQVSGQGPGGQTQALDAAVWGEELDDDEPSPAAWVDFQVFAWAPTPPRFASPWPGVRRPTGPVPKLNTTSLLGRTA